MRFLLIIRIGFVHPALIHVSVTPANLLDHQTILTIFQNQNYFSLQNPYLLIKINISLFKLKSMTKSNLINCFCLKPIRNSKFSFKNQRLQSKQNLYNSLQNKTSWPFDKRNTMTKHHSPVPLHANRLLLRIE